MTALPHTCISSQNSKFLTCIVRPGTIWVFPRGINHLQNYLHWIFKAFENTQYAIENKGTPGRTRTCDPLLRSPFLADNRRHRIPQQYQAFRFKELPLAYESL